MKLFQPGKPIFKGNLHLHTTNSDGRKTPEEAIELYQSMGYDFLAVTDHNKRTVDAHFCRNMLVLPGIELDWTLAGQVIHVLGINVDETIVERFKPKAGPQAGIDAICAAGGRAILAHPCWSLNTPDVIGTLKRITAVEVYNSVSGYPWNGDRADSTVFLDLMAGMGKLYNTVANDDTHFYTGEEGMSFTCVQADSLKSEDICKGLDSGAFYSSQGPVIEQIEVENGQIHVHCSAVKHIIFHSNLWYVRERCVSGEALTEAAYPIHTERDERYVRIILIDENGKRAWSNPIAVQ